MQKVQIITFNPWLYTELGHSFIYTSCIEDACKKNNWSFRALLPTRSLVEVPQENWYKVIKCPTVRHWFEAIEGRPYRRPPKRIRARNKIVYYHSAFKILKKMINNKYKKKILFLEAFAETDIKLLTHLLRFLSKKNLSIWLIHRYQSEKMGTDLERYKRYHKKFIDMGINLKLLTDSDLLKEDLEKAFQMPFTVLPIHHVDVFERKAKTNSEKITCWWPGVVRAGKGLNIIEKFAASSSHFNKQVQLVVNETCDLNRSAKSPEIIYLKNDLPREEYVEWMQKSDVILLPYNDTHYQKATSGIFIEAIMAGSMPVVYPNTWMAYELKKNNLSELVLDWNASSLSEEIIELYTKDDVQKKLGLMKEKYHSFHSIEGYASILRELITH